MACFKAYRNEDYKAVCDFLIELNKNNKLHINWSWARFEWMYAHPEFDKGSVGSIGLWWDNDRVVGAAIYDMYFGEGFCGTLDEYEYLYTDVLDYAYNNLKDEGGFGVAICDEDKAKIKLAEENGFVKAEQTESMMKIKLLKKLEYTLPDNMRIESLNPAKNPYDFNGYCGRALTTEQTRKNLKIQKKSSHR